MKIYQDRTEAGRLLAEELRAQFFPKSSNKPDLILAIPRGGVVVGAEVAREFKAPLDVWLARKIGAPGNSEFAIGSISSHGKLLLDHELIRVLGVSDTFIENAAQQERIELERRLMEFSGRKEPVQVQGKTVILVDDGVATGSTALAAIAALKSARAQKIILAVPVVPADTAPKLESTADKVLFLSVEPVFYAVGQFYRHFEQVEDSEVIRLLAAFSR